MTTEEKIQYWLQSAEEDAKAADDLFAAHHYHWSLFIRHLTIEKGLKAGIEN